MTHEEQRKQVWVSAWTAYTTASNSTSVDYAQKWADRALKDFDERFPEKPNDYDLKAKQEINKRINHLQEDYGQVTKLFPNMSHDVMMMEIRNLKTCKLILDEIELNHIIQRSDTEIRVIPRSEANNNPEEPEIHKNEGQQPKQTLPPEHWEYASSGCYDVDCLKKDCTPDCENLKCNSSPDNRESSINDKPFLKPGEHFKLNYEVVVECPNCEFDFDIEGHVIENVLPKS